MLPLIPVISCGGRLYLTLQDDSSATPKFIQVESSLRTCGDLQFYKLQRVSVSAPGAPGPEGEARELAPSSWLELRETFDSTATKHKVGKYRYMNAVALVFDEKTRGHELQALEGAKHHFRKHAFRRLRQLLASGAVFVVFQDEVQPARDADESTQVWDDYAWRAVSAIFGRLELLSKLSFTSAQEKTRDIEALLATISSTWVNLGGNDGHSRKRRTFATDDDDDDDEEEYQLQQETNRRCKRARNVAAEYLARSQELEQLIQELDTAALKKNELDTRIKELLERATLASERGDASCIHLLHEVAKLQDLKFKKKKVQSKACKHTEALRGRICELRRQVKELREEHEEWERLYDMEVMAAERIKTLQECIEACQAEAGAASSAESGASAAQGLGQDVPLQPGSEPYLDLLKRILQAMLLPKDATPKKRETFLLGLPEDADARQIAKAYKRLSLLVHPDRLERTACVPTIFKPLLDPLQKLLLEFRDSGEEAV